MIRRNLRHIILAAAGAAGLLAFLPAQACDESQQRIVTTNPDDTDARDALARSCARAGQHEAALAHYERLLERDANNVDWLLGKSQALIALGRPGEALPFLERARGIAPAYEDIRRAEARAREAVAGKRTTEHGTRVSLNAAYEDLSGGRPSWRSATLGVDHRLSAYRHLIGGAHVEERFDSSDGQFSVGWADRAGSDWSYGLMLDVAPDGEILPEWNLVAEAARALPQDFGLNFRARHADYQNVDVDSLAIGIEKYFAAFRASYTLTGAEPTGLGTSYGHALRVAHDYGEGSHVTFALGYGEEAETIAPGVVQVTKNRSVSVNGLHWRSGTWGFTWEAGWYEQGDLYDRMRISLGLERRF